MAQSRRAILRAVGVAGVGGLAGCTGDSTESAAEDTETETETSTVETTERETATADQDDADTETDSDAESTTELDMAVSELVGDGTDSNARFGATLALDADGTTAVVTASDQNNADEKYSYDRSGALYIFEKSGGSWSQEAQFVPEDLGVEEIDAGVAVSGDGTTVISDITADDVGKVTVLEKSGGSWASQTELSPPVETRWNRFASEIALSSDGRTAIITDRSNIEIDSESQSGVAYVFEQSDDAWSHQDTLYDSGAYVFGGSVSFSADDTTVVVGASEDRKSVV